MKWSLIGLVCWFMAAGVARAAFFTVNSTTDARDSTPGNGICETALGNGVCTLRAAIEEANALTGADTIKLPAGTYVLTTGFALEIVAVDIVTSSLTIIGDGAAMTIIERDKTVREDTILLVGYAANISGVTIRNGSAVEGGGIRNWNALLTLIDTTVSGNSAQSGGGVFNNGTMTLINSTVSGNSALVGGGIINEEYGAMTLIDSTISDNTARIGGGIDNLGNITLVNSTVSGNLADHYAGGINSHSLFGIYGNLALTNSTVSGNRAIWYGGGIVNSRAVKALNSTITGNVTVDALSLGAGVVSIPDVTWGGTFTFENTIIANNVGGSSTDDQCEGPLVSNGNNLMSAVNCTIVGGGVTVADPLLGPLQNNGGPTKTHALLPGSPAINGGNPNGCKDQSGAPLSTDQRGFPRPSNGTLCDIGAYELFTIVCPGDSLQAAVNAAKPGDTIPVSGTCNENILIHNEKQRITIDGAGAGPGTRATITGGGSSPVFNVRGKGILIQNFTVAGGSDGVHVNRGSNAVINNNIIENTNGNGILIDELAFAVLTNNSIQNNPGAGVFVSENSTARIGFNSDSETVASTNTIPNNAVGILISNGSSARIVGNTIDSNSGDAIQVLRDSHAEVSSNQIFSNGGDGIEVGENSFVQLGEDSGTNIFESPNASTNANQGFGIRCTAGGTADGRLGTLNGILAAKEFSNPTCIDSLN